MEKLRGWTAKAIIGLGWVTVLAFDFYWTLPPMIHPIIMEVSVWTNEGACPLGGGGGEIQVLANSFALVQVFTFEK